VNIGSVLAAHPLATAATAAATASPRAAARILEVVAISSLLVVISMPAPLRPVAGPRVTKGGRGKIFS
jgi:hypothetical protein